MMGTSAANDGPQAYLSDADQAVRAEIRRRAATYGLWTDQAIDPVVRLKAGELLGVCRYESTMGIDVRPVFKLSEFVLARSKAPAGSRNNLPCTVCGEVHEWWTHGCVPIAWPPYMWAGSPDHFETAPATPDSIPTSVAQICDHNVPMGNAEFSARRTITPHRHADFRWSE